MGRLEIPLPDLGTGLRSLDHAAEDMQRIIKAQVPEELRDSVIVSVFRKDGKTGLAIEYDDRAESHVLVALEYPRAPKKE